MITVWPSVNFTLYSCLTELSKCGNEQKLAKLTEQLAEGLKQRAAKHNIPLVVNYVGAMFGIYFTEQTDVSSYQQVMACDSERFKQFFHAMLDQGIYLAPSAFEAGFMSLAHSEADIEKTLNAAEACFIALTK